MALGAGLFAHYVCSEQVPAQGEPLNVFCKQLQQLEPMHRS